MGRRSFAEARFIVDHRIGERDRALREQHAVEEFRRRGHRFVDRTTDDRVVDDRIERRWTGDCLADVVDSLDAQSPGLVVRQDVVLQDQSRVQVLGVQFHQVSVVPDHRIGLDLGHRRGLAGGNFDAVSKVRGQPVLFDDQDAFGPLAVDIPAACRPVDGQQNIVVVIDLNIAVDVQSVVAGQTRCRT